MMRNSVPFSMKLNGISCHKDMFVKMKSDDISCGSYCIGMFVTLGMKPRRNHVEICELNPAYKSVKAHSWFKLGKSQMTLVHGSKIRNSYALPEAVFQESEEKERVQGGNDELGMDSLRQNLPPWGNFMIQEASDIDCENVTMPSTKAFTTNGSRVHFLEETDAEQLSSRILMLSRSNKVRSALELFRSMDFSGIQPNRHACNSLLSCLIRNNLLDNALEVLEFMKLHEIATAHAYSLILKAVADIQGSDSAFMMFLELSKSPKVKDFDAIVYNTMISVCGRVKNWDKTERIWASMKENGRDGTQVTYELLASIFVRCGQNQLALDAYSEMVENGLKPRVETMQAVIGAGAKEGKWDLALNVFQNMLNMKLKPNLIACNVLINALGKAGEVSLAFKVFKIVKSLGYKPDAYTWNALLTGLYRANQHADALLLFESIRRKKDCKLNEHLYNTTLMSCQKLGLWDKAVQLLWHAETSGQLVSTATYNLVVGACEVARKPKIALEVYEHMVHQKCTPDTFTYLSLVRGCIWASLWNEVEEILDQVVPNVSLYNAVIHGMCLRGKVESAKRLYMKMCSLGLKPDGKTRALMLQNLRNGSTKRSNLFPHPG